MRAEHQICDRCGKTRTDGNETWVLINGIVENKKIDLCPVCRKELIEFLTTATAPKPAPIQPKGWRKFFRRHDGQS